MRRGATAGGRTFRINTGTGSGSMAAATAFPLAGPRSTQKGRGKWNRTLSIPSADPFARSNPLFPIHRSRSSPSSMSPHLDVGFAAAWPLPGAGIPLCRSVNGLIGRKIALQPIRLRDLKKFEATHEQTSRSRSVASEGGRRETNTFPYKKLPKAQTDSRKYRIRPRRQKLQPRR